MDSKNSASTTSDLKAQLLGETAKISWKELEPFFAKGVLIWVSASLDLVQTAVDVGEDNVTQIKALMQQGVIEKIEVEKALDWQRRDPELWAVVAAPWVLVQEKQQ